MKSKLNAALLAAVLATTCLSSPGCKEEPRSASASSGGAAAAGGEADRVGVVDLDKVANDLGWLPKLKTNQAAYQQRLKEELTKFAMLYRSQIEEKRRSFIKKEGDTLTQEQQQLLMNMIGAYNQTIQQLDQQALQRFQAFTGESVKLYRDTLTPVVRQVAQEKKIGVVLIKNDAMIAHVEPTLDISNAVVDGAQKRSLTVSEVSTPSLEGPASLPTTLPTPSATQPGVAGGAATQPTTKP